ncbi:alcohol dehydrogenase catalytic domain-containing protein [Agrobacterium pusense]|uniref:alcohol dehydrogenase catalytic domain-containing protein n=1 Tax=Agrobacterium pusense TaxID=648995 RepID=UPI003D13C76F
MQSAGGPSVLQVIEKDLRAPRAGEVRLIQDAVGLNFVDTMVRKGQYPMALPAVPGFEAAGTIAEVGSGVEGCRSATGSLTSFRKAPMPPRGSFRQRRSSGCPPIFRTRLRQPSWRRVRQPGWGCVVSTISNPPRQCWYLGHREA